MRGAKAKKERKLRERDIRNLEQAVNHNFHAANALHREYVGMMWSNFWSQVAIAALLQHVSNRVDNATAMSATVHFDELEKAVLFVPPEGERGLQI